MVLFAVTMAVPMRSRACGERTRFQQGTWVCVRSGFGRTRLTNERLWLTVGVSLRSLCSGSLTGPESSRRAGNNPADSDIQGIGQADLTEPMPLRALLLLLSRFQNQFSRNPSLRNCGDQPDGNGYSRFARYSLVDQETKEKPKCTQPNNQ